MEPLLLFTIDGAQFIDVEDAQWELLLPVVRAADGGCLVVRAEEGGGWTRGDPVKGGISFLCCDVILTLIEFLV